LQKLKDFHANIVGFRTSNQSCYNPHNKEDLHFDKSNSLMILGNCLIRVYCDNVVLDVYL